MCSATSAPRSAAHLIRPGRARRRQSASPAWTCSTCSLVGLGVTGLIVWITEYYTGTNYRPVQSIARASQTGHGTNIIQGLAISLESTALPTLVICVGIIVSYQLAGLIGIAFAATAMLALAGMVVALDAYGPVTDNAGGIAEMAGMEEERPRPHRRARRGRQHHQGGDQGLCDRLGRPCRSGPVRRLYDRPPALLERARHRHRRRRFQPVQPLCRRRPAARRAAALSVRLDGHDRGRPRRPATWSRRCATQFRDNPGIMAGTSRPNYARTVDLVTKAAIKEMIVPVLLPVLAPIVVFFVIHGGGGARQRLRRAGRAAARRDRLRPVRRHLDDLGRRRLGQCQEVYRGRQLRRQGLAKPTRPR